MGIEAINPFELPLLNTVILLSSGVTVTYAHHSLIQGNRSGALYGLVATVILAIIFTALQGIEYAVSSFTISDGAFGSCFYFATGFHGLTKAPTNLIMNKLFRRARARASSRLAAPRLKTHAYTVKKFSSLLTPAGGYINNSNKNNNLIIKLDNKTYILGRDFLEWFVGFTDAEGNFNISLRKFKDNKYNSLLLTFQ